MSAAIEKAKRIEAEKQLTVARRCLEKIGNRHSHDPERDALEAIDEMFRVGQKQPLQALVGHERRSQ
ncbi:MAG: hypothetical protein KGL39_06145 [Patescibacteria group bacterium]|nr:hypothetical protein [Patescibacteria group bacterium]